MRDFGERSEKKGEEGIFFGPGEGVKTFLGQENGGWGARDLCFSERG